MSEKRRDKRNRISHNGETQRPDGRYRFTYLDTDGNKKDVYSWRLDHNDPYPKGKKKDPFGSRRIDKVKLSDAKAWLIELQ